MKFIVVLGACLITAALGGLAKAAEDPAQALQKGLFEEEVNHDLNAAVQAYETVIKQFDPQQKLAAIAVFKLGECYRKMGQTNEAIAQYQRLLRDFSTQTNLVAQGRQMLATLGSSKPAPEASPVPKEGGFQFGSVIEDGQISSLRAMIKNSPDLINGSGPGVNPLYDAARQGQTRVAEFLLQSGADIEGGVRGKGATPLHAATGAGHKLMVELLLRHGAAPNVMDKNGATPLHMAAARGFKAVTDALLAGGADPSFQLPGNTDRGAVVQGESPLHVAASAGHADIVKALLSAGAALNPTLLNGVTPLHAAISSRHIPTALLLLEAGANVKTADERGMTPLHVAASYGLTNLVAALLAKKADINAETLEGLTPLMVAVAERAVPVVQMLLKAGAKVDVKSARGETALSSAADEGHIEIVDLLLKHGAEVDRRDGTLGEQGSTPLQKAVFKHRLDVAERLLASGAAIDALTVQNETLLHWAAAGYPNTVEFLLKHKADPNARDRNGATPLHRAARARLETIAGMLLRAGADPNALDNDGDSPLTLLKPKPASAGPVGGLTAAPPPHAFGTASMFPPRAIRAPGGATPPVARETASDITNVVDLLRRHGGLDMPLRRSFIWVHRPELGQQQHRPGQGMTLSVFAKGTNTYNRYSLLEGLCKFYAERGFEFPDWSEIAVERLPPEGQSNAAPQMIRNIVGPILKSGDCAEDIWLQWGDVIIIPEADHPLHTRWSGTETPAGDLLTNCLQREITIVIKDTPEKITVVPMVRPVPQGGIARNTPGFVLAPDFRLNNIVRKSNLLRASSDLSRIMVIRHDPVANTTKNLQFDLTVFYKSTNEADEDLWLRNNDIVVIPDKGQEVDIAKVGELVRTFKPAPPGRKF